LFAAMTDDERSDATDGLPGGVGATVQTNADGDPTVTLATKYCAPLGLSRSTTPGRGT